MTAIRARSQIPLLHLLDSITVPLRTAGSGWVYEDQDPLDAPVYKSPEQSRAPLLPACKGRESAAGLPLVMASLPACPGQASPSFWSASRLPSWIFKVPLMKMLGTSVALQHFFHFVGSPIHRFAE